MLSAAFFVVRLGVIMLSVVRLSGVGPFRVGIDKPS